jgi:hypothetical protein
MRRAFAVIKVICRNAQGQRLDLNNRFFPALAVNHDAGQVWDFGYPATVIFSFNLDSHPPPLTLALPHPFSPHKLLLFDSVERRGMSGVGGTALAPDRRYPRVWPRARL